MTSITYIGIRMRDDVKAHLKETKQQIIAYYTRHGFQFDGSSHWTQKHLNWVEKLQFKNSIHQEVLREYLTVFYDLSEKVAVYDARIEELACFIWGMMTGNISATALH